MSRKTTGRGTENPLLNHLLDKARAMEGARDIAAGRREDEWPRRTWVISDGTAGMLSQSLALLRVMGIDGEDIRAVPTPLLRAFPKLAKIPGWQLTLGRKPDWLKLNQWPDLCITCGRRMAGISIGVKRLSGGRTKTIHIQDPRLDPGLFDLLVTPKHDAIAQADRADNLITTTGALNRLSRTEIARHADEVKAAYEPVFTQSGKLAVVMIGGHNRRYKASAEAFVRLAEELARFADITGARLVLVPSRRTPKRGMRVLADQLGTGSGTGAGQDRVWICDAAMAARAGNPYPGVLGLADYIVVTSDSVNMASEAALTGKPVLIAELAAETGRIAAFHTMMRSGGHTAFLRDVLARPDQLDDPFTVLDERAETGDKVWAFFGKPRLGETED